MLLTLSVLVALRQAAMWPMSSACYWLIAAPEVCFSIASFARILLVGVSSALVIGLSVQQLARLPLCHHFVSANNMLFAIEAWHVLLPFVHNWV